ncbi:MAG TPA: nucleotide exchange factor GrpE [Candidatus Acidoferrum sp.]|jgi:molecular chaperone GrpE|nr:nucleotide exchange factor GrpE [Candidatus Acidoferrum sp.]
MKKHDLETTKQQSTPDPSPETEPLVPVEPAALTAEQLEELKQRATKADENWERLVRTTADFDNYKKRAAREKQEAIKFANESLLEKLIPVLDTFDMALAATQNGDTKSVQSLQTGIGMVHQQLKGLLTDAGLETVDATGKPFDPNLHEAVAQKETTEAPEGQVIQQMRKGYKLRDRLLRPATVVVAKSPAADTHP